MSKGETKVLKSKLVVDEKTAYQAAAVLAEQKLEKVCVVKIQD